MDEPDVFVDDDLDDIPDNTLLELELNAISSTQRQKPTTAPAPAPAPPLPCQQLRKPAHNASSLSRTQSGNRNVPWRPPQRQTASQSQRAPPISAPDPPSSQYDFGEENVIDLDEPSIIVHPQRTNAPALLPKGRSPSVSSHNAALDPETAAAFAAADAELGLRPAGRWAQAPHLQPPADDELDFSTLQARVAELEAEQARLRQAEQQARNAMEAKQGEIAIVRANHDRERKEFGRRLSAIQRSHAEEAAKQKAELDAGRKEREKMQTDNRFLQHDLAQEAEKVKRLNGPGKARAGPAERDTPRKSKRTGLGDGFDDDEVYTVSPSRSKDKAKDTTPKAGSKRKRSAQDSPLPGLSFTKPPQKQREYSIFEAQQAQHPTGPSFAIGVQSVEEEKYIFTQRMLNHRPSESQKRSLELLSQHAFPSATNQSLASILLDDLSSPLSVPGEDYMPMKLARIMLNFWKRSLEEQHYAPLCLIVDMVQFALLFELQSLISQLVEEAVPLCLKSLELVTLPIVRAHLNAAYSARVDKRKQQDLEGNVDADAISDFLLMLCRAATLSTERIEAFWRTMDFTNSMLLLHKALPMERVIVGLKILSTSASTTTFGAIHTAPTNQEQQEKDALYRLTFALFDIPTVPEDEPAYSEVEDADFRVEVLNVFKAMLTTDHGSHLLASHAHFIGRLVRFLDEQIRKLYTLPPSKRQFELSDDPNDPDDGSPDAHDLVVKTINMSVRILYHLLRTHESSIDLSEKFAVVTGGYHKFLISMTRIAFIEQPVVLEFGIEDEVIDAAHAILDAFLTPEDGEAVAKALETPYGSTSTTTRGAVLEISEGEEMEIDEDQGAPG